MSSRGALVTVGDRTNDYDQTTILHYAANKPLLVGVTSIIPNEASSVRILTYSSTCTISLMKYNTISVVVE